MEHKAEKSRDTTPVTESKGVLGSVWSAAGHIAETVQHAVQGTLDAAYQTADRIQHQAEPAVTVGGYVAHKVAESASIVLDKTKHTAESVLPLKTETKVDPSDAFFSSPTDDMIAACKSTEPELTKETTSDTLAEKTGELFESAKKVVSDTVSGVAAKAADAYDLAKQTVVDTSLKAEQLLASENKIAGENIKSAAESLKEAGSALATNAVSILSESLQKTTLDQNFKLELTMDVVAHLQRIADRTGDKILHETARKAHSACAKGLSDSPGVHLVRVTPDQATELVNLAILTQDHELADFARYCQSVAATSQIGIEPYPGKIKEELEKGRQELSQQGRMHTGPGYGAAFASVTRQPSSSNLLASTSSTTTPSTTPTISPSPSLSSIPAAAAEVQKPAQQVESSEDSSSSNKLTMDMVAHIQRIADRTGDQVLHDTARKAHSACAKGLSEAPGVHLVSVTPDQASELVNLAIRTQDHELANFARYCQSVAATTQLGIEPTPGKIKEEIEKGRQELQQLGRTHTGPGYGAAFASISRSNSQQNLVKSATTSRSSSPTNIPLVSSASQSQISVQPQLAQELPSSTPSSAPSSGQQPQLQLTMDVVAHLQRIADRTGDALLHETARKAHSACAKNVHEAPGVHLVWITPEQATELVNLAIRTQDTELADFARYCQSVAATTQIGVEPSPGKIKEEIEKGRQELQQQGRAHTGPGYGAAFASKQQQQQQPAQQTQQQQQEAQPVQQTEIKIDLITPVQSSLVGQPSQ